MDREVMGYIYNGTLFSHEKKRILPFATIRMDPEGIILSEIRQRMTITVCSHLYVESKPKTKNNNNN